MTPIARGLPALAPNRYRDLWCGQALADRVGEVARVAGWIHRRRDHGGLIFIDLRDRTGLLQLVFNPDEADAEAFERAHRLRAEDVLSARGEIVRRSPETVNPSLATGEVELRVAEATLLADAATPPFEVESYAGEVSEELRLRYRYLDLRRETMREAILLRHRIVAAIREFFDAEGFVEIETPVLTRSTPEGARDFLVPSRLQQGSFYALPQSPQLFKQLLMVAGFERYYQIARCFRDEDLRADRQLDFTQLDVEMSFVEREDVLDVNERMLAYVLGAAGIAIELPLPRLAYDDALARYGTDKPDLRYGLEIAELTDAFRDTGFNAFRRVVDDAGVVRGINAGTGDRPRSELDGLVAEAQELGARGLVWAVREPDGWRSPVAKFLSAEEVEEASGALGAGEGDLLLIVADREPIAAGVLGQLRTRLAERQGLIPAGENRLCWILDWPLVEWNEDEGRWDALHHPFTSPAGELDPADPAASRALIYDVAWNGQEIGGGSIRISDPEVQRRIFEVIGIGPEEAEERFGFLLEALRYGAPPHGGIAYGIDRIVALAHGAESIRDVIAFPKAASGADPLTGAPAPVSDAQLRELGIALRARPGGT